MTRDRTINPLGLPKATTVRRITIIAILLILVALVHFLSPIQPSYWHAVHVIMRKLFVLPVVLGAVWFRFRGAMIVAGVATILFGLHAAWQWSGHLHENINQAGELVSIWIVAIFGGILIAREHKLSDDLMATHHGTVHALVAALDAREHDTQVHSRRVQAFALQIASGMRLNPVELHALSLGALLHDVGKIGVPDSILLKPGPLDDDEWTAMRRHPDLGRRILQAVPFLDPAVNVVYAHHERFDGSGYPQGLAGERIPITARVFAVADVFDALISKRPYKPASTIEEARQFIITNGDGHFDPKVVAAFEKIPLKQWSSIIERIEGEDPREGETPVKEKPP